MKFIKILITVLTAFLLGMTYQVANSNATAWHSGTPAALRGHWKQKTYIRDGNVKHVYYNKVVISKKIVESQSFGSMPDQFTHIKWRKLNHNTYLLHARRFIDGYNHKIHRLTIKKTSHNRMYMHLDGHAYLSSGIMSLQNIDSIKIGA